LGTGPNATNWNQVGSQPPIRVSSASHSGSYAMQIYVTNSASTPNNSEFSQNLSTVGGAPVVPGTAYNLSFWARRVASGPSYVQNYGINWLNGSGGSLGFVGWTGFASGNGVWLQTTASNLVAPAGAVNALIQIYGTTGAVSGGHGGSLIDDISLSPGASTQTNVLFAPPQPGVEIGWPSSAGKFYDVQWSADLGRSAWSNLVSALPGNGGTNRVADVCATNELRFYRVSELP